MANRTGYRAESQKSVPVISQGLIFGSFLHMLRRVAGSGRPASGNKDLGMAVPKKKVSRSRRGMRRSHDTLKPTHVQEDQHTGEFKRRHHIDLKSGQYRGRQVIAPKEDL